jgi:hypothetical protein
MVVKARTERRDKKPDVRFTALRDRCAEGIESRLWILFTSGVLCLFIQYPRD